MIATIVSKILEQAKGLLENLQDQAVSFVNTLKPGQVDLQFARSISSEEEERICRVIETDTERVYRNRW
jgi:hypothetical protein